MAYKLYLSDRAYYSLVTNIPPRLKFKFFDNLSRADYLDNRDQEIKDLDEVRLANGYYPLWLEPYPRLARHISFEYETVIRLGVIASKFKITKWQDVLFNDEKFYRQGLVQHASNTLEAIGQNKLKPVYPVQRPKSTYITQTNKSYVPY